MFENITKFFKKFGKSESKGSNNSKDAAKERLHLVLMQDRANVSADFLELMKQEIIEVIKKYIDVDERAIDVRLTNKDNGDGTTGAPALYANIPIKNIKNEARKVETKKEDKQEENKELKKVESVTQEQKKEETDKSVKLQKAEIKENTEPEKNTQIKEIVKTETNVANEEVNQKNKKAKEKVKSEK